MLRLIQDGVRSRIELTYSRLHRAQVQLVLRDDRGLWNDVLNPAPIVSCEDSSQGINERFHDRHILQGVL